MKTNNNQHKKLEFTLLIMALMLASVWLITAANWLEALIEIISIAVALIAIKKQ